MNISDPPASVSPCAKGPQEAPEKCSPVRKIFYLLDSLDVGGTETQAVELACRLSARGHHITLGCLKARGPLSERVNRSGVVLREFYPKGGIDSVGGAYQLMRLSAYLRRKRFDVVHSHDLWSTLLGIPAAW